VPITRARSRRGSLSKRGMESRISRSPVICLYVFEASRTSSLRQHSHGSEAGLLHSRHWNGCWGSSLTTAG
jgi:hypothetical protein